MPDRVKQRAAKPTCENCQHPISFHGGTGKVACRAHGCECEDYKGLTELALSTVTAAEAAEFLGRSWHWVRSRTEELGGTKVKNSELYVGARRSGSSIRYPKAILEKVKERGAKADGG